MNKFKVLEIATSRQNGEQINRMCLDVRGHDVQIISYDNDPIVSVQFDNDVVMMDITQVDQYIEARL